MRAALPWLGVLVLYATAVLTLGATDPAPVVPPVLERLEDAVGTRPVELGLAALAALAFGCGAAVARRMVPDPWATRGVLFVALSPLGFAMSSSVRPGAIAAAMLTAGLLLTLRVRETATRRHAGGAAFLLAFAPWFGLPYAIAAVPLLVFLIRSTLRQRRPLLALIEFEIAAASGVALAGVAPPRGSAATPGEGAERLLALLVDRHAGVLRWAPVLLLVAGGAYLLLRSRQEQLAKAIPARREAEAAALLCGVVAVLLAGAAAFSTVSIAAGLPCAAALGAWALQRAPRIGGALGGLTLALTVLMAVALATGDSAGWLGSGPLADLFPAF